MIRSNEPCILTIGIIDTICHELRSKILFKKCLKCAVENTVTRGPPLKMVTVTAGFHEWAGMDKNQLFIDVLTFVVFLCDLSD